MCLTRSLCAGSEVTIFRSIDSLSPTDTLLVLVEMYR